MRWLLVAIFILIIIESSALSSDAVPKADPVWRALFARFPPNVPRAIEFPLVGDDLEAVTRQYVAMLASV